jgi:hypothetical protein
MNTTPIVRFIQQFSQSLRHAIASARQFSPYAGLPTMELAERILGDLPALSNEIEAVFATYEEGDQNELGLVILTISERAIFWARSLYNVTISSSLLSPEQRRIWRELLVAAVESSISESLRLYFPSTAALLEFLGIFSYDSLHPGDAALLQPCIRWDRTSALIDPRTALRDQYHWGSTDFDSNRLLARLAYMLNSFNVSARIHSISSQNRSQFWPLTVATLVELYVPIFSCYASSGQIMGGLTLCPVPTSSASSSRPFGLAIIPVFAGALRSGSTDSVELIGAVSVDAPPTPILFPDRIELLQRSLDVGGEVGIRIRLSDLVDTHFGSATGSRLWVSGLSVALLAKSSRSATDLCMEVSVENVELHIASPRESFWSNLVPSGGVTCEGTLKLSLSTSEGLRINGGVGLSVQFPGGFSFAGFRVEHGRLELSFQDESFSVYATVAARASLGPLNIAVSRLGLGFGFSVNRSSTSEDTTPFDGFAGFRTPRDFAFSLSAGAVMGGGGVSYDDALGRYTGALSLSINNTISLRAVGILDTRAPGVTGYSFLIAISSEFTPIQLGMGFTLNGVGGICGIQRSVSPRALQEGVRNGSLAPLLFARDPVAQASQLVTGLSRVFPPTADRYVFGPMFKFGWGTPTLVTIDLGIVLQLPAPILIALIGTVHANFPAPGPLAIVEINLDIVGVLDMGEKTLSIDASLRDSRVAAYTFSGDMAFRLSWGEREDFVLSIGGFHKAFRPPPGFPELRRVTLPLTSGASPRVTLSAYLAVTSNTFQIGARAELSASALGFDLLGYLQLDALITFRPFAFRFDFAAGFSLRRGSSTLAAITVAGLLMGPRPWHVEGSASISILFFDVSVRFSETFGEPALPEAPQEVLDLWASQLEPALRTPNNWIATLPGASERLVTVATPPSTASGDPPMRLDPLGTITFKQRALPLNRRIAKYGEKRVAAPTTFSFAPTTRIGTTAVTTPVAHHENFAASQFQQLTDAEKLSRPSFERMEAGATFSVDVVRAYAPCDVALTYEVVDLTAPPETPRRSAAPSTTALAMALETSAIATAPMKSAGNKRFAPAPEAVPLVTLEDEKVVIVRKANLRAASFAPEPFFAHGEADDVLRERLRTHPNERGEWCVVSQYEAVMS